MLCKCGQAMLQRAEKFSGKKKEMTDPARFVGELKGAVR